MNLFIRSYVSNVFLTVALGYGEGRKTERGETVLA